MSGTVAPCFSASRQELRRKLTHDVAVERHIVRDPKAEEDREQQQRVFRRLSKRFRLVDQQAGPLYRRLGFRRGIAFHMEQRGYERDLKLDLLPTQRGCARQGRKLVKRAGKLRHSFYQRRPLQRPLPRLPPQARSLFDQSGLGAVTRQQLRLVFGNLGELAFKCFGDTGVKRTGAARAAMCRRPRLVPVRA